MIKVLIVDDHQLVNDSLATVLKSTGQINVVGQASTGEEAMKFVRESKDNEAPDVVLLDLDMPGIGGLETLRKILRYNPDIAVLMFSAHKIENFASHAFRCGAKGFITKGSHMDELVKAIRMVKGGQRYIAPELAQQLALNTFAPTSSSALEQLSEREMQVLLMVTSGQSVADIAEKLHLSSKTVNSYRYRIFSKLDVSNDVELTHLAIKANIILTNMKEESEPSNTEA